MKWSFVILPLLILIPSASLGQDASFKSLLAKSRQGDAHAQNELGIDILKARV